MFIQSRSILDDPLMMNETLSWLKKTKREAIVFKVEFEKAFDSVSWQFLDGIMEQMAFPVTWRF